MPTVSAGGVLRPICSVSVSSSERVDVHTPHLYIAFSITGASQKGLCFQSISCKVECVVQKGWLGMSSSNIGSWGKEHVMCICTVCHTVQWLLSHSLLVTLSILKPCIYDSELVSEAAPDWNLVYIYPPKRSICNGLTPPIRLWLHGAVRSVLKLLGIRHLLLLHQQPGYHRGEMELSPFI